MKYNILQNQNLLEEESRFHCSATNADLKNATGVDTSKFAEKVDLENFKFNVDK